MRVLYAGDGPVGGAADYLLGILGALRATVTHVLPTQRLGARRLSRRYDLIILSDFPRARATPQAQRAIAAQAARGTGLLMIGGWASFSGRTGRWAGSVVERVLPVRCVRGDDRLQASGGLLITRRGRHLLLRRLPWAQPPVVCGLNRVRPRASGQVLLEARPIRAGRRGLRLGARRHPLLVVSRDPVLRAAALTTDVAPHWCGGLVDWGATRRRLRVSRAATIEVGSAYVQFLSGLLRWLARSPRRSP